MEVRIIPPPDVEPFRPARIDPDTVEVPSPRPSWTRRTWVAACLGGVAGVLGTGGATWALLRRRMVGEPACGAGTLATVMLGASEADLVRFAVNFERQAISHIDGSHGIDGCTALAKPFERLLQVASQSNEPGADTAGAASARTLLRLGRRDILEAQIHALEGASRPETMQAIEDGGLKR